MAIEIVNGSLLDAEENLIVHQVNCKGEMNTGIAEQIKEKWGQVFRDYKSLADSFHESELLGTTQAVVIGHMQAVVNLFGQGNYGYDGERYTNYEAIYSGLESVAELARRDSLSVAIPYNMGCDRGGANWEIVYKMIEVLFKDIDVKIYKYNPSEEK